MIRFSRAIPGTAAAALLLFAAAAFAQVPSPVPAAPRIEQPSISAGQAVSLGLTHDPSIQIALKSREYEQGVFLEASGQFDPAVHVALNHAFERTPLTPALLRKQEGQRRLFRILSEVLQRVADDLQAQLDGNAGSRIYIDCARLAEEGGESVLSEGSEIVIIDPETGQQTSIKCTTPEDRALQEANDAFLDSLIAAAKDEEQRAKLEAMRARGLELSRSVIQQIVDILDIVAAEQRERLRMLGHVPTIQHRHVSSLLLGYSMPFRSGVVVTPTFALQRTDEYLIAKRTVKDGYGGRAKPTTYEAAAGFQIDVPLLRGRGFMATAGPERAAEIGVAASDADYRHSQSASAYRTLLDYWTLVAAQQRLALYEESLARQQQLSEIGQALLAAEEVTRIDVMNVDARIADGSNAVATARASVDMARVALARDIGLRVERLEDAPLASDDFPPVPAPEEIAALRSSPLFDPAAPRRFDVLAASRRLDASRVILATAREALRPRLDLAFTVAYVGFMESQHLGKGFRGALFDEWVGPSMLLTLAFELPMGNNAAIGRFAQASALENQGEIGRDDLVRRISTRVTQALGDLQHAAEEVRAQEEAAALYRRTIDDEMTKYRSGVSTIIDVILTEENLTNTLAALIDARLAYATALARLRFETGMLVRGSDGAMSFEPDDARRLPL